ncbi:Myosin type-2 heavy chain 1 [Physocladia obscura]|uniref:Myosin type-2 heavy chain 1 n=1 Tax=Physocladia obscura TaxID=109957 RepID=A0AAD5T6P2_9FUNG|nr:Myosin type-2 heavy chain 1 [Physocladia obscura]
MKQKQKSLAREKEFPLIGIQVDASRSLPTEENEIKVEAERPDQLEKKEEMGALIFACSYTSLIADYVSLATTIDMPAGVLELAIYEAKNLKNLRIGMIASSVSNPYVRVKIGNNEVARSKTITNSLNPFWEQILHIPIMPSSLTSTGQVDLLSLEIFDETEITTDKCMGIIKPLRLSRWIKLLGDSSDVSTQERDALITEWGTPYTEDGGNDIWHMIIDPKENQDIAECEMGEMRLEISFKHVTRIISCKDCNSVSNANSETSDSQMMTKKSSGSFSVKHLKRQESCASLNATSFSVSGILSIKVISGEMQLTNIDRNHCSLKCGITTRGIKNSSNVKDFTVLSTKSASNTDKPCWNSEYLHIYITDSSHEFLNFTIMDEISNQLIGNFDISVRSIIKNLKKSDFDWYSFQNDKQNHKLKMKFNCSTKMAETPTTRKPKGILKLKLIKAHNLANVEIIGRKSDPYAKISIEHTELGKSHVKENTLDPSWNEIFFGIVYSRTERLVIELWDYNKVQKDKTLGHVEFSFEELLSFKFGGNGGSEISKELIELKKHGLKVEFLGNTIHIHSNPPSFSFQKGFLFFDLEYFEILEHAYHINPLDKNAHEFIAENRDALFSEISRINKLKDDKIVTAEQAELKIKQITEKRYDEEELELLMHSSQQEIAEKYDSGILRFKVYSATNIPVDFRTYVTINIDNECCFSSHVHEPAENPSWNATSDICICSLKKQVVTLHIMQSLKVLQNKPHHEDSVVAVWKGDLSGILGKKRLWIKFDEAEVHSGKEIGVYLSVGFMPIAASLAGMRDETGTLYIDLERASSLEENENHLSNSYCLIYLNETVIHKSNVFKHVTSPVFNETINISILQESRLRCNLKFVLKSYNRTVLHYETMIGSVDINLGELESGKLTKFISPLCGARSGYLHFNLFFEHSQNASLMNKQLHDKAKMNIMKNLFTEMNSKSLESIVEIDQKKSSAAEAGESIGACESEIVNGTVYLTIEEAKGLKAVDKNGASDPYVKVIQSIHGEEVLLLRTKVIRKTLDPVWQETVSFQIPPSIVSLVLQDKNILSGSKALGEIEINFSKLFEGCDTFDKWINVEFGGSGSWRFNLGETMAMKLAGDSAIAKALLDFRQGTRVYFKDVALGWTIGEAVCDAVVDDTCLILLFRVADAVLTTLREVKVPVIDIIDSRPGLPPLKNPDFMPNVTSMQDNVDDLSLLSYLHEPAILDIIKNRFTAQQIYTYSGMVLIAVNPFATVDIYSSEVMFEYSGKKRDEVVPHIYGIAEECYRAMLEGRNQSVIVSGESGAGKTQSTKYIMQYLAAVESISKPQRSNHAFGTKSIENAVLASNPILEAFGNAKTARNNNSSRFGKFVQLYFSNPSTGDVRITGARIRTYLLERSRLSFHPETERNYHIFYQLCAAIPVAERKQLGLDSWESFHYLNQGKAGVLANVDEIAEFKATQEAFSIVGVSISLQWFGEIFSICAALLHVGNISVVNSANDSATISLSDSALLKACELLQVNSVDFAKWITKRQNIIRGEKFIKDLKVDAAIAARDSVTKVIYTRLFDWLVNIINKNLETDSLDGQQYIGILDIYGFEHFKTNSFEQFCINYANEKLQQEFNAHVFRNEQDEYTREAIEWRTIEFRDNLPCVSLIESKLGILGLLDEESRLPNGTDANFINKLNSTFAPSMAGSGGRSSVMGAAGAAGSARGSIMGTSNNARSSVMRGNNGFRSSTVGPEISGGSTRNSFAPTPASSLRSSVLAVGGPIGALDGTFSGSNEMSLFYAKPRFGTSDFIIKHYALDVQYSSIGFIEKNMDTMSDELFAVLSASSNELFKSVFLGVTAVENAVEMDLKQSKASKLRSLTLGSAFKASLQELMDTLRQTKGHYIRCIKPNITKAPFEFDGAMVLSQLQACGVLETIKISNAGYPNKLEYNQFAARYCILVSSEYWEMENKAELTRLIVENVLNDAEKYQFGKTKVFFKSGQIAFFENRRKDRLSFLVVFCQKNVKRNIQRRRFLRLQEGISILHLAIRGYLARKRLQERKTQEELARIENERKEVEIAAVVTIQSISRGFLTRRQYKETIKTMVVVQNCVRAVIAKRKLETARKERDEINIQQQQALVLAHIQEQQVKAKQQALKLTQAEKVKAMQMLTQAQQTKENQTRAEKEEIKTAKTKSASIFPPQQIVADLSSKRSSYALEAKIISLSQTLGSKVEAFNELQTEAVKYKNQLESYKAKYKEATKSITTLKKEIVVLKAERDAYKEERDRMAQILNDALKEGLEPIVFDELPDQLPIVNGAFRISTFSLQKPTISLSSPPPAYDSEGEEGNLASSLHTENESLKRMLTSMKRLSVLPPPTNQRFTVRSKKSIYEQDFMADADRASSSSMVY